MAIPFPEKTEKMKQAVADVMAGKMNCGEAARHYELKQKSVVNAVARHRKHHGCGLHEALMIGLVLQ